MNSAKATNRFENRYSVMILILCSCLILLGCSNPLTLEENKVSFDGYYFPYKLVRNKADDRSFDLTVKRANRSLLGAREAGRYEATRFCIKIFGTSDIKWFLDPDDENISLTGRVLKLSGQCDV
jgi:hypothetical protein